jgi:hypothetical protein
MRTNELWREKKQAVEKFLTVIQGERKWKKGMSLPKKDLYQKREDTLLVFPSDA